jgi:copper chaperone CopZ
MTRFTVPDMTCDGCVRAITAAVKRVAPQAEVKADLSSKRVEVSGDTPAETVAEAMRDAGFTPALAA